ncbi:MAG: hypothetical protein ACXV5G_11750 [Halobacteriota archaeon]
MTRPPNSGGGQNLATLQLTFSYDQLTDYKTWRMAGLDRKSVNWMEKAAEMLCNCSSGIISKATMSGIRNITLNKYVSEYSRRKILNFTKGFLKYLTKTTFDTRYLAFELFLAMPKVLKTRKHITSRIITKEDVENLLTAIKQAHRREELDTYHYLNYTAIVLFGAFTGQRPLATIARLIVGQLKEAVRMDKPVVDVLPSQDKIRMQHYVPLHPQVVDALLPILDDKGDDEHVFEQLSFQQWLRYNEVRLRYSGARIVNGDLRKFAEQYGDIIQWEQSNRAYILTHGVSGVEWSHYRHPLPEFVYGTYTQYWGDLQL